MKSQAIWELKRNNSDITNKIRPKIRISTLVKNHKRTNIQAVRGAYCEPHTQDMLVDSRVSLVRLFRSNNKTTLFK